MYKHLGKILPWPMIDITPVPLSESQRENLLKSFGSADLIVLTSWYAVEHFFSVIPAKAGPHTGHSQELGIHKTFAVIGRRTEKALQEHGIQAAIVSTEETAEGLFKAITQHINVQGKHILFPRSSLPNPFLKDALEAQGAIVEEIAIYVNTKPAKKDLPSAAGINGVIFTSPSTVRNFLADYGTIPSSWQIMAKGPVTLKTLQEAGYHHAASLS
jgi:uroporphyrinogen-III synthase